MTEILKAILTGLEQVREHRLLPALGKTPEDSEGEPRALQCLGSGDSLSRCLG